MKRTMVLSRWMYARQLLPRDVYFWLKATLLALVAVQLARLFWTITTPLGPVGEWLPASPQVMPLAAQRALISTFDPFSRGQPVAAMPTASMPEGVKLFGTRADSGSLAGSAIIQGADGIQTSYTVGDEIAPGVRLAAVAFDFVVLDTGGAQQKLFMEGSQEAAAASTAPAAPGAAAPTGPTASVPAAITPEAIRQNVAFAPRTSGARVTGLLVSPVGSDAVMRAAGLQSGDVIVALNGRRITSAADVSSFQSQVVPGARLSLLVERGADTVPVALTIPGPQ